VIYYYEFQVNESYINLWFHSYLTSFHATNEQHHSLKELCFWTLSIVWCLKNKRNWGIKNYRQNITPTKKSHKDELKPRWQLVTQLLTNHNTQGWPKYQYKIHTKAHKSIAYRNNDTTFRKLVLLPSSDENIVRGTYSVLNVQGRVQTVGDIGEINNNNCQKHKATQSLEVKIWRKFPASNGVEN
jgi:hypothetical protein